MTYTWVDVQQGQVADDVAINTLGNTVEAHDAQLALLFVPLRVVKAADESVPTSTTLQDDNHLFLTLPANGAGDIEMHLFYNAPAAGDLKVSFTGPSGLAMTWGGFGLNTSTTLIQFGNLTMASFPFNVGGSGGEDHFAIWGNWTTTSGGTLQLQWAQVAASGTTIVRAGSSLLVKRFA